MSAIRRSTEELKTEWCDSTSEEGAKKEFEAFWQRDIAHCDHWNGYCLRPHDGTETIIATHGRW